MADLQSVNETLERLEAALSRISDASTRLREDVAAAQAMAESDERHRTIAAETAVVAERLDSLIVQLRTALAPKDARG